MTTIPFSLPPSPTPRPGERVIVFDGKTKIEGVFHGYNINDDLIVKHETGSPIAIENHIRVRTADPFNRQEGCWRALSKPGQIVAPEPDQVEELNKILSQRIPPGPTYYDFVYEIWARGYEVFLVGGTVRDVIRGTPANDVDLVTTIPFNLLAPIVEGMFGFKGYSRKPLNGFISVGHEAGQDVKVDPLMDVKNFFLFAPGTKNAQFGSDISIDYKLRDFSCNSIYYDPINEHFLDPCGHGISDAKANTLNLVNDTNLEHPNYKKANISLRFFKFIQRGYIPTEKCIEEMVGKIKPEFSSMGFAYMVPEFKRHLLGKFPAPQHESVLLEVKDLMHKYEYGDIWEKHFKNRQDEILGRNK